MSRSHLLTLALLHLSLAGCYDPNPEIGQLRRENLQLKEQVAQQQSQLAAGETTIAKLRDDLSTARGFGPQAQSKIFSPVRIQLASLSGPADLDGRPGEDGVIAYVQPVDAAGDVIKVAGDAKVQSFDLAAPGGPRLLGECEFPVDTIAQHWYGQLLTYHYTLKCPWSAGRPSGSEVTVRVEFRDYLTRAVLTTQGVYPVRGASASTTSAPAGG